MAGRSRSWPLVFSLYEPHFFKVTNPDPNPNPLSHPNKFTRLTRTRTRTSGLGSGSGSGASAGSSPDDEAADSGAGVVGGFGYFES